MTVLYRHPVVRSTKPTKTPQGARVEQVIYVPLPRDMWEPRPGNRDGYLDTLAIAGHALPSGSDVTWMVHRPDLHGEPERPAPSAPGGRGEFIPEE